MRYGLAPPMKAPMSFKRQLDAALATVAARVERLYDALHHLATLTNAVYDATGATDERIRGWADDGFVKDPDGYYERRVVLERARAGDIDPDSFLF